MAGSGGQPDEGKEEFGEDVEGFGTGGGRPKGIRALFKSFVQAVLLFGEEAWVLTPWMEQALSSFQNRVERRITGGKPRRRGGGSWYYPPLAAAIAEVIFGEIRDFFTRRQNMVVQYIATRPSLDLCERSVRRPVSWVYWRWWYQ